MNVFYNRSIASLVGFMLLAVPSFAATQDTANSLSAAVSGSGKAQHKAIDSLGARHENATDVVPKLRKLLKSDDQQVRWRSARALGDYGSLAKESAPDLAKLLTDKDPIVDYHAAIALGKIEDHSEATLDALINAATN